MTEPTIEQLVEAGLSSHGRANWIAQRVAQLADDLRGLVANDIRTADERARMKEQRRLDRAARSRPKVSTDLEQQLAAAESVIEADTTQPNGGTA